MHQERTVEDVVHGGIRHLENSLKYLTQFLKVHGGIRHLEKSVKDANGEQSVHGGIRHLESFDQ
ncbi:Uncharacterised protein [Acinetobacter baumannii]|nr:Uncharacterised protein [Acinetobacter baumannii]SSV18500.1 Uncharacterised protein [Acinetobacter baumannii]